MFLRIQNKATPFFLSSIKKISPYIWANMVLCMYISYMLLSVTKFKIKYFHGPLPFTFLKLMNPQIMTLLTKQLPI
jgi:uncharacterized membrane protein YbhN (UPF0104 family)